MSGFPSRTNPVFPGVALGQPIDLIGAPSGDDFLPVDSVIPRASYPELAARFREPSNYASSIVMSLAGDRFQAATDGDDVIVMSRNSSANHVLVSSNGGVSWSTATTPTTSSGWCGLMYGNGVFVVARYATADGCISGNGTAWSAITLPASNTWVNGVFGGGVFVLLPNTTATVARSTNGTAWTTSTLPVSGGWNLGFWDSTRSRFFVHMTNPVLSSAYSADGTTWTAAGGSGLATPNSGFALPSGRYVVVGGTSDYATSDDGGATWTPRTLPVSRAAAWRAFSVFGGVGAIAQDGSATLLSTEDGENWTASLLPFTGTLWTVSTSVPGKPYALLTTRDSLTPVLRVYPATSNSDIVLRGPAGYYVRVR